MANKKTQRSGFDTITQRERQQQETIERYKKQHQLMTWSASAIALLVLLLIGITGYASNWWTTPNSSSSFKPDLTGSTEELKTTTGTTPAGGGGGSATQNRSTTTNSTTANNSTTSTTNNTTTKEETIPTVNDLLLLGDIELGDSVQQVLDRANSLGLSTSCHTTLLAVQVCEVSDGNGGKVTLKNITGNNALTGLDIGL